MSSVCNSCLMYHTLGRGIGWGWGWRTEAKDMDMDVDVDVDGCGRWAKCRWSVYGQTANIRGAGEQGACVPLWPAIVFSNGNMYRIGLLSSTLGCVLWLWILIWIWVKVIHLSVCRANWLTSKMVGIPVGWECIRLWLQPHLNGFSLYNKICKIYIYKNITFYNTSRNVIFPSKRLRNYKP